MTQTTMQPQAHNTDPVVNAVTSSAKPTAARTSVRTSMPTPQVSQRPDVPARPLPRAARGRLLAALGERSGGQAAGGTAVGERLAAVHRNRRTAVLQFFELRFQVGLQPHPVLALERLELLDPA